jgi:hypothetical protein
MPVYQPRIGIIGAANTVADDVCNLFVLIEILDRVCGSRDGECKAGTNSQP